MRLGELVADIRSDATTTLPDTYRKTRVTYLTAPPRVANYLERPEALRALRNAVFAEDHRQPVALTALSGMGGIGKTVLAKALTDVGESQKRASSPVDLGADFVGVGWWERDFWTAMSQTSFVKRRRI